MTEFDWTAHCKRWWMYTTEEYDPSWYEKLGWPARGDDEWGRRTVVIGTRWTGYVVWAWRTCWCQDCHEVRAQAYRTYAYTKE